MIPIKNKNNEVEFYLISNSFFLKNAISNIREIALYDENYDDSYEIKTFISDIFYKKYKAKIKVSYPELMCLTDKDNRIFAALGIRSADKNELFLEQYLDDKIENVLTKIYKNNILRNDIVEIGSLASQKRGMARFLYITLALILKQRKYKYAIITGTDYLLSYFKKAGLKPKIIAQAKQSRLKDQNVNWGSYYKTSPKVMALDVSSGYFILRLFLRITIIPALTKFYPFLSYE